MLDDSGIFVELQPGTLSIDFPLLVPIDKLNKVEEIYTVNDYEALQAIINKIERADFTFKKYFFNKFTIK